MIHFLLTLQQVLFALSYASLGFVVSLIVLDFLREPDFMEKEKIILLSLIISLFLFLLAL